MKNTIMEFGVFDVDSGARFGDAAWSHLDGCLMLAQAVTLAPESKWVILVRSVITEHRDIDGELWRTTTTTLWSTYHLEAGGEPTPRRFIGCDWRE